LTDVNNLQTGDTNSVGSNETKSDKASNLPKSNILHSKRSNAETTGTNTTGTETTEPKITLSSTITNSEFNKKETVTSSNSDSDAAYLDDVSFNIERSQKLSHVKKIRRIAAYVLAIMSIIDILSATSPPLRYKLATVRNFFPLNVQVPAAIVVGITGLILLFLARAVRRGQRSAWIISCVFLTISLVGHILRPQSKIEALITLGVLIFLLLYKESFQAKTDLSSMYSAILTLVLGTLFAILSGTVGVKIAIDIYNRRNHTKFNSGYSRTLLACLERMVGFNSIKLPDPISDFVNPVFATLGIAIIVIALALAFRPIVESKLHAKRAVSKAFDIVEQYGENTLDYFALRDDKKEFIYKDSLVAYAIYGGVCIVSPDPIGPIGQRIQVWQNFLKFADTQGWAICVMAASEEWLEIYKKSGLSTLYIGDEAVVDLQTFSLAGGEFKSLRQAYNRIAKYGYTIEFFDPQKVTDEIKASCLALMPKTRRGGAERGFSMTLGRIFDPRDVGLLLAVAKDDKGNVVAFCHYVPARGIKGYSLDLMRRDPDKSHPNGLIDYVICSTIFYLKDKNFKGLDLNFATWRAVLAGESGEGKFETVKRWILKKMSGDMQIESLWKFNDKYGPEWLPRYVAFENVELAIPTAIAIARAESFAELPLLGKFFTAKPK
jgi:lysylphosphatidylglycerol synthetase-like protein (DUF2156 family)